VALETPNAIAAAVTLQYDPGALLGERFVSLASNGVLDKLSEFHAAGPDIDCVAFSLETPITAEEGMPFCSFLRLVSDGGEIPATIAAPCFCMVKSGAVSDPAYDALPDGSFVLGTTSVVPVKIGGALLRIPRG
jgi:hypothetical protein